MTTGTTCRPCDGSPRGRRWGPGARDGGNIPPTHFFDPAALMHQVRRYRDRADRTEMPLSMIVVAADGAGAADQDAERLGTIIQRHLGELDAPWFAGPQGDTTLVVFLIDTPQAVADQLARQLTARAAAEGKSITCSVQTYWASAKAEPAGGATGGYPLGPWCYRALPRWKRSIDVVGSGLLIAAFSPVLALVAAFIKLVSRGPVCFVQERVGAKGRPFRIIKFRTMCVSNDADTHRAHVARLAAAEDAQLKKIDKHCRLIPLGWLLRATCIDELPQLFNVLRGDMSLVGPRPDVLPLAAYRQWQLQRFDVLPGMTGLWQVSGKNRTTFTEMIQLDIRYVKERSLWLDLKILALTPAAIAGQACAGWRGEK